MDGIMVQDVLYILHSNRSSIILHFSDAILMWFHQMIKITRSIIVEPELAETFDYRQAIS